MGTLDYYNENALDYFNTTVNADMDKQYKLFLKYLRKTGYEIMKAVKSHTKTENVVKSYIIKKENEGKLKKVAKIAGLNKFLRIYYGCVKKRYRELNIW